MGEVQMCQCCSGELRWLAAASWPDICARLAQSAARVNSLRDSDIYRIDGLVQTVKEGQEATILLYASSSYPSERAPGSKDGEMRIGGEKVNCGAITLAGWSDAAYGDQTKEGRRRLGYVIRKASSTLRGPCREIQ